MDGRIIIGRKGGLAQILGCRIRSSIQYDAPSCMPHAQDRYVILRFKTTFVVRIPPADHSPSHWCGEGGLIVLDSMLNASADVGSQVQTYSSSLLFLSVSGAENRNHKHHVISIPITTCCGRSKDCPKVIIIKNHSPGLIPDHEIAHSIAESDPAGAERMKPCQKLHGFNSIRDTPRLQAFETARSPGDMASDVPCAAVAPAPAAAVWTGDGHWSDSINNTGCHPIPRC
nr:hypothetical protein CFP56_70431 [Quercus suber]